MAIYKNSKRNTVQKQIVYDIIKNSHKHLCADEVYIEAKKVYKSISRATIFRILNSFAESGSIAKLRLPYGADCYDSRIDSHSHFQCKTCGSVMDVEVVPSIYDNFNGVLPEGYKVSGCMVVFEGLCPGCAQKH